MNLWVAILLLIVAVAVVIRVMRSRSGQRQTSEQISMDEPENKSDADNIRDWDTAISWASTFGDDFSTAWRQCPKAAWLFLLAGYLNCDRKEMILAASDCMLHARANPDIDATRCDEKTEGVFPDAGHMFAWVVLNSDQINLVKRCSRGEVSLDDCRKAEAVASESAASIFPGACQNALEAEEASVCRCMHIAIKYYFRAMIALETWKKEGGVQKAGSKKDSVRDAFRQLSRRANGKNTADPEMLFIFNLAMAAQYASFVINSKTEPSKMADIVRDRLTAPEQLCSNVGIEVVCDSR